MRKMLFKSVLLLALIVRCNSQCGENEKFLECGTPCPKTCSQEEKGRPCPYLCVNGCFCKEGFVRSPDNKCIRPEFCPPAQQCGDNEEFSECGPACPKTCSKEEEGRGCITACVSGCFCKKGFIRSLDGKCIRPEFCPPNEPKKQCGENEEFLECGTACPKTCSKEEEGRPCPDLCVSDCFCKEGFVRGPDNKCIRPELCPPKQQCGDNEVFSECGTACPETCSKEKGRVCIQVCVRGCFCKGGFVRSPDGQCIPPEFCPPDQRKKQCGENEEFLECGTACPKTCSKEEEGRPCPELCVSDCFCKEGFVKSPDNKCIRPELCPPKQQECPEGKIYNSCGSECESFCRYAHGGISCLAVCVPGCFCPKGLYENERGECVTLRECRIIRPD